MSTLARTIPDLNAPASCTGTSTGAPVRATSSSITAPGSAARRMTWSSVNCTPRILKRDCPSFRNAARGRARTRSGGRRAGPRGRASSGPGAIGTSDQSWPAVPTSTAVTFGPAPAAARQSAASKRYSVTTTIEDPARRVSARVSGGNRVSAIVNISVARCLVVCDFLNVGAGNGSGSRPWTCTAAHVRPSAEATASGEVFSPAWRRLRGRLLERDVRSEPEPVADDVRRRLGADRQHLDVDARPQDAGRERARLEGGHQHRRAGPLRQVGQRRGRVRGAQDHVIERQLHAAEF